jgi:putative FmdB family regulatory protein
MPLYEYQCNDCTKVFEKLVSFSDANREQVCPTCQSHHTQRKLSKIASTSASSGGASLSSSSSCGSGGGRFS